MYKKKQTNDTTQLKRSPISLPPSPFSSNPHEIVQRAQIDPRTLTHGDIVQLQKTVGNQAVGNLVREVVQKQNNGSPVENLAIQRNENRTGLPDRLKSGVESLSGMSMSDVKVHYNSKKPATVQAHAYAQGSDIHVASGQEKHLAHEAWHVVQQKQGRVKPTTQIGNISINDNSSLEREADVMGGKAVKESTIQREKVKNSHNRSDVIQGYFTGPPPRYIALAYEYVKTLRSDKQALFEKYDGDEKNEYDFYDFLADELDVHMNDIFDWEDGITSTSTTSTTTSTTTNTSSTSSTSSTSTSTNTSNTSIASNSVIKNFLEEGGCDLTDDSAINAVRYAMARTGESLSTLRATGSGGESNTIIPSTKPIVIQYFRKGAFENIKIMYKALRNADTGLLKNVANILSIDESLRVAVMEKVIPLNQMFNFFSFKEEDRMKLKQYIVEHGKQIFENIQKAILGLAKLGLSQGDVSLDNIGIKDGKFVLFDYDKAGEADVERDEYKLGKSIKDRSYTKPSLKCYTNKVYYLLRLGRQY